MSLAASILEDEAYRLRTEASYDLNRSAFLEALSQAAQMYIGDSGHDVGLLSACAEGKADVTALTGGQSPRKSYDGSVIHSRAIMLVHGQGTFVLSYSTCSAEYDGCGFESWGLQSGYRRLQD